MFCTIYILTLIEVPFKDNQIDFETMELFVGIVKKVMIKDVRTYIQKKQA